jgi:carbamoyl-phosphate synthase large subunit
MKYKVLMTGAGAPGGPAIIKSLLQLDYIDLFIADASDDATGKYMLPEKFFLIPKADTPGFIEEILSICVQNQINLIFPLVTRELFKFSEHLAVFRSNEINVIVSERTALTIAVNKCRLYEHLSKQQIELPKFKIAGNHQEFLEAINFIGFPDKPFCVKPGLSNGSRGIRIVDNSINKFDLLFNYKPNSIYMDFDELNSILKQNNFPELLVSEVLPGEETTVDTMIDQGKIQLILPRKRLKIIDGITVSGEFFHDEALINYVERILGSLQLNGPIGIQLKKNSNGDYRVLEINPRIQGTSVAAAGLGINLPELILRSALNLERKYPPVNQIKWGTKFFKFYDEVFY